MERVWAFLKEERNRQILAWAGGGFVVIISGLWAVYLHYSSTEKTGPSVTNNCGSVGVSGNVMGGNITAGNTGNCSLQQKPSGSP